MPSLDHAGAASGYPSLAPVHERVMSAVAAVDEAAFMTALTEARSVLAPLPDDAAEAALLAFDALVDAHLDTLRSRWSLPHRGEPAHPPIDPGPAEQARFYAACIEDFYAGLDLPVAAFDVRLRRAQLSLEQERHAEAEALLREAADVAEDVADVFGGALDHHLGVAIAGQGRLTEAIESLERAVELSRRHAMAERAASSLDRLGWLLDEAGQRVRGAEAFLAAAALWRGAGQGEEATESETSGGWILADIAREAANAEGSDDVPDVERAETFGLRALQIGDLHDEALAATAALNLALVHARTLRPAQARAVLEPRMAAVERLDDLELLTVAHLVLVVAHVFATDLAGAEIAARRAVPPARASGNDELLSMLLGLLAALAQARADHDSADHLYEESIRLIGGTTPAFYRERRRLERLAVERDQAGMRQAAQDLLDRTIGDPDHTDSAVYALGYLLMLDADAGDAPAAERRLEEIERLSRRELDTGDRYTAAGLAWTLPAYEAFAAMVSPTGQARFGTVLDDLHARLMAGGSAFMAARMQVLRGYGHLRWGRPEAAVESILPAFVATVHQLYQLPSSAEREALRAQIRGGALLAVEAAVATGDTALVSELVEVLRGQSIPLPSAEDSAVRSVAAILDGLTHPASTTRAPGPATDPAHRGPWTEQETSLVPPPSVVMPWGAPALGRFLDRAARYAPGMASSGSVPLVVPR